MTHTPADDLRFMQRALELARRGLGLVEPNPQVGCVLVQDGQIVGEGWHQRCGGPHAEVNALAAAGSAARGATAYVTLEPCCHHGKTGPCTEALLAAGVARVVVGRQDPNPQVAGRGLAQLRAAGIQVDLGILAEEAAYLVAPFAKLVTTGRPWVIAKWAMTLDGKIATRGGDSRWISGAESRADVHALRGRMDAIVVGRGTAEADDPLLTARPPGPRTPVRIVVDSQARLSLQSRLVRTAGDAPLLVATSESAPSDNRKALADHGAEVLALAGSDAEARLMELLAELGRRQMTNVLVEGGAHLLGSLWTLQAIDEVQVYLAPKVFGGNAGLGPLAGLGVERAEEAAKLSGVAVQSFGDDVRIAARVHWPAG